MKNPFGYWYPAGAENDPNAPWNEEDHAPACPLNEEWQCDKCKIEDLEDCPHGEECICAQLDEDAKSDAADAKYEAERERKFNP